MKYICFSLVERIRFEFSFKDTWRPSMQHTVSDENQRRLTFGFSVVNLHSVGAFVFNGKLIHHHLDKASWLVTLDSVCLGAQKEGENSTVKFLPPVFSLAPNGCINYCILRDHGAQKTHKKKFQPLNLSVNQRANEGPLGEPKIKRGTFGDEALGLRGEWPTHEEPSRNSAHSSGMCSWCEITQHTGERERGALGHVRSQNHRQQPTISTAARASVSGTLGTRASRLVAPTQHRHQHQGWRCPGSASPIRAASNGDPFPVPPVQSSRLPQTLLSSLLMSYRDWRVVANGPCLVIPPLDTINAIKQGSGRQKEHIQRMTRLRCRCHSGQGQHRDRGSPQEHDSQHHRRAASSGLDPPNATPRMNKSMTTFAGDLSCRHSCFLPEEPSWDLRKGFPAWVMSRPRKVGLWGEMSESSPVTCGQQPTDRTRGRKGHSLPREPALLLQPLPWWDYHKELLCAGN